MKFVLSLATGLLAACTTAISNCGTSPPSNELRSIVSELAKRENQEKPRRKICIDTYIHVIAASEQVEGGYLSDDIVQGQMTLLNERYAPHGISFNLVETDRTVNESWAFPGSSPVKDDTEPEFRAALRKGDYSDLNLYFVVNMVPGGKCELPIPQPSEVDVINDGCLLRPVEPETSNPDFGLVTVHEVGHWLGLFHTFNSPEDIEDATGCDGPGDYVDDTPAEAYPVGGDTCPEPGRDTCPGLPGLDPIDNYMTYVADECGLKRFTPGQARRMHKMWANFRLPFKRQ